RAAHVRAALFARDEQGGNREECAQAKRGATHCIPPEARQQGGLRRRSVGTSYHACVTGFPRNSGSIGAKESAARSSLRARSSASTIDRRSPRLPAKPPRRRAGPMPPDSSEVDGYRAA